MATQEFTYQDVAEHNTKKDLYLVIHDVVYDAAKFVDEHPYVSDLPFFLFVVTQYFDVEIRNVSGMFPCANPDVLN